MNGPHPVAVAPPLSLMRGDFWTEFFVAEIKIEGSLSAEYFIKGAVLMLVTWNKDEGRDLFFFKIKEKYKISDEGHSGINNLIEELLKEKHQIDKKNEEIDNNINHYIARQKEIETQIEQLGKELSVQQDYYKIEEKHEYKNRIDSLQSSIENFKKQLNDVISKHDNLCNQPQAEFLKSELLINYMKYNAYFGAHNSVSYSNYEQQYGLKSEIDLPPLFKGEEVFFSKDDYKRVLDALKKQNIENVYYYSRNLFYSEEDKKECKPEDWVCFSKLAVEIKESLAKVNESVYMMNNRLFMKYSPDCFCQVTAYRIKENIDFNTFYIAIAENRQIEKHPIYPEFQIKYPNNFIIFNEGILLKHSFYANQTSLKLKFRKADYRNDDD